ncbi:MAG: CocE/NonD family hydrolase [Gemmatimonadota bacterium]|nr:CocE/NonD family hydrolase [Gemmatimonadota bacterium]
MPRLTLVLAALLSAGAIQLHAQDFTLAESDLADSAALAASMPRLASQLLGQYEERDRRTYLDTRFRLQMVAGRYREAAASLAALHALRVARGSRTTAQDRATNLQYEIYVAAMARAASGTRAFAATLPQAFHARVGALDDRISAMVMREFNVVTSADFEFPLRRATTAQQGKSSIPLADALRLLRSYQQFDVYRALGPFASALVHAEDERRYVIDRDVLVTTPEGAKICALIVRPRRAPMKRPALLEFTIYADSTPMLNEARRSASNGYVGIEGMTRGKGCSPDAPVPYEHDGADAAALIDWIAAQPWSDGQVGMFAGSYDGFTQWAAAKHMPAALKALMPSVTAAPGIDVPMEGNVFQSFVYYWPLYAAGGHEMYDSLLNDRERWQKLFQEWYVSGRAYRDLDKIDGTPNPFFDKWLDHPSYDAFWQSMIPYREEFAKIDIPVLTTTGYYDGGEIGALYYLAQHYEYNRNANHYLVIGPYDHIRGQRGTTTSLGDEIDVLDGYTLDSAAHIDLGELRYRWFDYTLKGRAKPALLKDRINYEVMGANLWRHAPSLAAMSPGSARYYLGAARAESLYSLTDAPAPADTFVEQRIDLADRTDIGHVFVGGSTVDTDLDQLNSVGFVSEPLAAATEVSGLFSGHLDFITNKRDFDISINLYELTPEKKYIALAYYMVRASYVKDRTHRELLQRGAPQQLDFTSGRLASKLLAKGSRVIAQFTVLKQTNVQLNYGTGKDVSDETSADAGAPLSIRWSTQSYIELPVRR